ncbi:MAG: DNA repair protein RecN [Rhodospirillaceae bacterium]|nr:DNA repair protein RecN [Rhodospirillaceae bacterium]
MLAGLTIRNVVLIESLSLDFAAGLCALTGETGSGKSILLDALGLALGTRADALLVGAADAQAMVTAEFDLPANHRVFALLADQEMAAEPPLVLRRTLSRDGRSRAHVNDQPVSIGLLRQVGQTLVEVHGQFDTHGLLNPATHRGLLDAHAGHASLLAACSSIWATWQAAELALSEARQAAERARSEEEFLRHAVHELDALAPQPGEDARLADLRAMLMNREKLVAAIEAAQDALGGDAGAARALGQAQRALARIADSAGDRLAHVLDALDRAVAETEDGMEQLQRAAADLDLDPGELERLEERLFALRALARKHGVAVDELAELRSGMAERLALIEDTGHRIDRLVREAAQTRRDYEAAAVALTAARRIAAAELDQAIARELGPLKLDKARFVTDLADLPQADWGPQGRDRVTFTVATNPGAAPGPLNRIASGGELARFMLALKVVLARAGDVPTLVLDEVDSGISGAVADAVGQRLAALAAHVQVLVVTHSPQVAARATHHLRVQKDEVLERVLTTVVRLEDGARQEEIARMLSGAKVTEQARAAAASLIGTSG